MLCKILSITLHSLAMLFRGLSSASILISAQKMRKVLSRVKNCNNKNKYRTLAENSRHLEKQTGVIYNTKVTKLHLVQLYVVTQI